MKKYKNVILIVILIAVVIGVVSLALKYSRSQEAGLQASFYTIIKKPPVNTCLVGAAPTVTVPYPASGNIFHRNEVIRVPWNLCNLPGDIWTRVSLIYVPIAGVSYSSQFNPVIHSATQRASDMIANMSIPNTSSTTYLTASAGGVMSFGQHYRIKVEAGTMSGVPNATSGGLVFNPLIEGYSQVFSILP